MPQEVPLPDGRILVIPDNMTLDQRAALRNKIGAKYADPKTGVGMQQRAVQQTRGDLASRVQPVASPGLYGPAPGEVPPGKGPVIPGRMASPVRGAEEHELAVGAPVGAAGMAAAGAMTNPAVRTGVGMVAGGKLARRFGIPTWIGATFGGAALGGGGFSNRIRSRMGSQGTSEAATPTGTPVAEPVPSLSQRASQRLVLTPEEAASQDRLQQIATEEARRRGMRSAAWGQQGQP